MTEDSDVEAPGANFMNLHFGQNVSEAKFYNLLVD
jgi:hypothetical protein